MGDYRRLGLLIVIMTAVALAVGGIAIKILYDTALREERQRLMETAQSQARLLESIVSNDLALGYPLDTAVANTIALFVDAHTRYVGLGETGEFTLARRQGDRIVYLLSHRHDELDLPRSVAWETGLAQPMVRALTGRSGTVVGSDYRGETVLAAHEPVALLDLGIVAKIDLDEVRAPFVTAAATVLAIALALIAGGTLLFVRVGEPMVARLRSSESRFRNLFDSMSSGVIVCEAVEQGADFLIKDINRAGQAIGEVQLASVAGRRVSETMPVLRESGLLGLMTGVWRSGIAEHHTTSTAQADGRVVRWQENYVYKLPSGEIVVLFDDVTERKVAEEELLQSQKTEVIGQLTGGVAHDFNNVLGIILGNLQMIRERVQGEARTDQMLDDAIWSARRGAELTRRLLAFARRQPLAPRVVHVNALLEGMRDLLSRTLGPTIDVRMDVPEDSWPVIIDPAQLEIAVVNLAVNARDAMPGGGTLRIAARNAGVTAGDHPVVEGGIPAGDYLVMTVSDSGTGISPEDVDRVFEPFFTTKSVGEGSGLGLSMVYGFVKQSGGHVEIDTAVGAGTTFVLYLPRAEVPLEGDGATGPQE